MGAIMMRPWLYRPLCAHFRALNSIFDDLTCGLLFWLPVGDRRRFTWLVSRVVGLGKAEPLGEELYGSALFHTHTWCADASIPGMDQWYALA